MTSPGLLSLSLRLFAECQWTLYRLLRETAWPEQRAARTTSQRQRSRSLLALLVLLLTANPALPAQGPTPHLNAHGTRFLHSGGWHGCRQLWLPADKRVKPNSSSTITSQNHKQRNTHPVYEVVCYHSHYQLPTVAVFPCGFCCGLAVMGNVQESPGSGKGSTKRWHQEMR